MKKISVLSVFAVLTMPVFAVESIQNLYGIEPGSDDFLVQYMKQIRTIESDGVKETAKEVTKETAKEKVAEPVKETTKISEEPKKAKEVKGVKKVKEVEETEKPKEVKKVKKTRKVKKLEKVEEPEEFDEPEDTPQIKEPEYEVPSNPDIHFPHGLQIGVGVSPTSGLNGFIGYNNKKFDSFWAKRFGIRFDFATMSPIKNTLNKKINHYIDDHNGIDVKDSVTLDNFTLDAKHYGAMIDFYPFGDTWFLGGWRISGGYFAGKMDLDADVRGTLNGGKIEFELNDKKYSYDGNEMHARATADWKFNGPYLGTGFDLGLFWGFKMYFDAGVVFTGNTAKFDLDIPLDGLKDENGVAITEGSAEYNQFIQDKDKVVADVRKEIKDLPYYPLVKIGVMYRF